MEGKDVTRRVTVYPFKISGITDRSSLLGLLGSMNVNGIPVMMDMDSIFNCLHLSSSIMHAARSIFHNEARAREPSIEVLRWLSGSHQVSRGLGHAGPGNTTEKMLLAVLPADWPMEQDTEGLPEVAEEVWQGVPLTSIIPMDLPVPYGGIKALRRLGLDVGQYEDHREMEKAVLEAVCMQGSR
ncbi:MAG: hypothetical protein JW939_01365 [Candidatus Thermoplasmatota archaeon]|nr:hypothetical protein [Candidatus Thermoplasmatota archaeon]